MTKTPVSVWGTRFHMPQLRPGATEKKKNIYIYIYRERERETERQTERVNCLSYNHCYKELLYREIIITVITANSYIAITGL